MTETLGPNGPGVHPVAAVFPLMEGRDFDELVEDIRKVGLREAIWLTPDGLVLDGRNRWRACQVAGVDPVYRTYDGDDLIQFVVSLNLKRRHLDESQRAMVAAKIANLEHGVRSDRAANLPLLDEQVPPPVTQAQAAELLNVSERNVREAKKLLREGADTVVKAVEQGQVSVNAAAKAVKAVQKEIEPVVVKSLGPSAPPKQVEKVVAEEAKKVQAKWTVDDIKAAVKEAKAEKIVQSAQEAVSQGKGNVVTDFMVREKRLPTPSEARQMAEKTGLGVVDSRGVIQPPVSLDRIESRAELDELWGALADILTVLEQNDEKRLLLAIPTFQRPSVARRLPNVLSRLTSLEILINEELAHGAINEA